jgi:N-acetylmuramoyl-L-alanine amidase
MAKKVVIDAGHGGSDPGTSANGIIEKDINLKISKYIYNRLKELGVDVALSRETDVTLGPNDRPKKVQSFFGKGDDVIVLSNHVNSGGSDISNYEGVKLKKLFTTTFLIFFSTATWRPFKTTI